MGCDIHFYVEKKVDDEWVCADKVSRNKYFGDPFEPEFHIDYDDMIYHGRNYDLFAILANVRNGYGFAGCKTGGGFVPISMPRGLPADVSPEIKRESDRWGADGHSHSHLLLKEILEYDWDRTIDHCGYINIANYHSWVKNGKSRPFTWCGDVAGGNTIKIPNKEVDKFLLDSGIPDNMFKNDSGFSNSVSGINVYTLVEWKETYRESADEFLTGTVPALQRKGDPDKVRGVYWFDN